MRQPVIQDKLYINGEWTRPAKGATIPVINPATEEVFFNAPAGTSADIDRAVVAARQAFDGGCGPPQKKWSTFIVS